MQALAFSAEEQSSLFDIVVAVLQLGNISFDEAFREGQEKAFVTPSTSSHMT